jgi:hypothetical protein
MRAERPLPSRRWHSGDDACRWLEHALADVAAASARAVPEIPADAASEAGERDAATGPDLQALCELADWPATPRGGPGEVAVALPGRGGATCHAVVSVQGTRVRFQVTLEVCAEEDVSPAGRAAIALALLHLVAGVRLVRATATRLDERIAAHLEVDLELPLEPELAGHALSALAVAHQHVAAELGVLASDRALARAYLTVQGLR